MAIANHRQKPKPRYARVSDPTLRRTQADTGYFSKYPRRNFRAPSNPTLDGYSSGYHESAVTTDTYKFLSEARNNGNGTHTLPDAPKNSFWGKYTGERVDSKVLEYILEFADGFRTDTAQTILSGPEGLAAGHSGSNIDTTGQSAAHDLLRESIIKLLKTDPKKTPGFTEKSVATILASITVTSIAPGELARNVKGGSRSLKAKNVKLNYETNRTEAKRRVEAIYGTLNRVEARFADLHIQEFMDSTQQEGVPQNDRRVRPSLRATSPERDTSSIKPNEVAGRGYLSSSPTLAPLKRPPSKLRDIGMYITEPFRALRRLFPGAVPD